VPLLHPLADPGRQRDPDRHAVCPLQLPVATHRAGAEREPDADAEPDHEPERLGIADGHALAEPLGDGDPDRQPDPDPVEPAVR
jgi:hypothetical protein